MLDIEQSTLSTEAHEAKFLLNPVELKTREPMLLTPADIQTLDPYNFKDLTATWKILNDSRQRHRFENQAETPHALSDIARLPKVTVYVVRSPDDDEIVATASITDPGANSREFETWWEHVATRVDMHGRGIGTQLGEAIFYDRFFQRRGPGNRFAENIYTATIIDGDHGPAVRTMLKLGFIPRARWERHIGHQTPAESGMESLVRMEKDEEVRFDSVRWVLTCQMFLQGVFEGKYDFLNRAMISERLIADASQKGLDFSELKARVEAYKARNDRSGDIRDILDSI